MAELFRFAAFISYSSGDARFAKALHKALESYGVPAALGAFDLIGGGKKNRIYPVFRDREELSAGGLGERIEAALKASANLIVVCSPHAATSLWVEKEIQFFAGLGRRDKIFAIITDNASLTDEAGADATAASFPPAFRGDALAGTEVLEPLAADARQGKDGFRNAWLKVVAGMIGVTPGQLIDRDKKRRRARRAQMLAACGVAAVAVSIAGAALDAQQWRTNLTQQAEGMAREGYTPEGMTMALGGAVARGAVLSLRDDAADDWLRQLGSVRMRAELGPVDTLLLSANGDKAFIQRDDAGETAAIVTTATGALKELGALGPLLRSAISADGSALLIHRRDEMQSGAHFNLATGTTTELGALGPLRNFAISADGARLAFFQASREASAWTLDVSTGAKQDLGRLQLFVPSANGANLLFIRAEPLETWAVIDWKTVGIRELGRLQAGSPFTVSADGGTLVLSTERAGDQRLVVVNLETGSRTELALGAVRTFRLSADGAVLAFQRDDPARTLAAFVLGVRRLIELGRADAPAALEVSADGGSLLVSRDQNERGSVLINLSKGARIELGRLWSARFSEAGERLIILRNDPTTTAAIITAKSGAVQELGALGDVRNFYLGNGGASLLGWRRDGTASVLDVSAPVDVAGSGARLAASVCAANADAVRPFNPANRSNAAPEAEADRGTGAILHGHPWNPCDWRGLAAIFPSPEHGDGWFEGPRQWLRLMHIRYFNGKDWSCEETTSRASAEARAARAEMCRRFAPAAGTAAERQ